MKDMATRQRKCGLIACITYGLDAVVTALRVNEHDIVGFALAILLV
jgi:hypothetical protein